MVGFLLSALGLAVVGSYLYVAAMYAYGAWGAGWRTFKGVVLGGLAWPATMWPMLKALHRAPPPPPPPG